MNYFILSLIIEAAIVVGAIIMDSRTNYDEMTDKILKEIKGEA